MQCFVDFDAKLGGIGAPTSDRLLGEERDPVLTIEVRLDRSPSVWRELANKIERNIIRANCNREVEVIVVDA